MGRGREERLGRSSGRVTSLSGMSTSVVLGLLSVGPSPLRGPGDQSGRYKVRAGTRNDRDSGTGSTNWCDQDPGVENTGQSSHMGRGPWAESRNVHSKVSKDCRWSKVRTPETLRLSPSSKGPKCVDPHLSLSPKSGSGPIQVSDTITSLPLLHPEYVSNTLTFLYYYGIIDYKGSENQ